MRAKRKELLIVDSGFNSINWLQPLFDHYAYLTNINQIGKQSVVVFEGGVDIYPGMYGEKAGTYTQWPNKARDTRERFFYNAAMRAGAACLGICRGAQLITALCGGKLIQDVNGHQDPHYITTIEGDEFDCNSHHHQMMNPFVLDKIKYRVLAWTSNPKSDYYLDGDNEQSFIPEIEPEIVYYPLIDSLCIQGHPEWGRRDSQFVKYCQKLVQQHLI